MYIYEALADAFRREGVSTQFALLGDANMHWGAAMETQQDVRTIHVRHEHCALGAAMGYHSATGDVGVATVTCGPGYAQITTALTSAAKSSVPLVILAGETPISAKWYHQHIDQQSLAAACGAHYIAAHSPARMHQYVREAFYMARTQRKPVVLAVPYDVQKQELPDVGPYQPSTTIIPSHPPVSPDPAQIEELAQSLTEARCPILVAGRGALRAGAAAQIEAVADRCGALLATSLLARGMFDHSPHSLGICGGYARPAAIPVFAEADLVVTFGASLSYFMCGGGNLFPNAKVVQVDLQPAGLRQGLAVATHYVRADAKASATALLDALERCGPSVGEIRSDALTKRLGETRIEGFDEPVEDRLLNPVHVFEEMEGIIPKDYDIISGNGHQLYYHTTMRGYDPARYHSMIDFGAVGNGISYLMGVAVARGNGRVALFDGDGGLMMHVQELETLARYGIKALIVCANDGAYGSEVHKLRADGLPAEVAIFGRPKLRGIAEGFGLRGAQVNQPGRLAGLLDDYEAGTAATVWDIHISDKVVNPTAKRMIRMGHGVR